MKQILVVAIALIATLNSYCQDNGTSAEWGYVPYKNTPKTETKKPKIETPLIFEDEKNNIYVSKVIELPKLTQKEVKQYFENWAALHFKSYASVNLGETENQIVIKYKDDILIKDSIKVGQKKVKTQVGIKKNGKIKYKKIYKDIFRETSTKTTFDVVLVAQFKEQKMKCFIIDNSFINYLYPTNIRNLWSESVKSTISSIKNDFFLLNW